MKMQKSDWIKIAMLVVVFVVGITSAYFILKPSPQLPIYNPSDLDRRLVDSSIQRKGRQHRTLPFSLVNQYGDTVTKESVAGKIYVADFFFTLCPDICRDMAGQKRRLQDALSHHERFAILSHSVTPQIDSVSVLREYAQRHDAIQGTWHLLTGPKKEIYRLARESYFAVLDEGGKGDEMDFIHTENFVLVDPQGRLRGFYDGTSQEDVNRLIEDFKILLEEVNKD